MELKIDKQFIDEAVQKAVEEIKQNGIWIPEGMTNGEVIQTLFPYAEIVGGDEVFTGVRIDTKGTGTPIALYTEWWNAPYQKGGE